MHVKYSIPLIIPILYSITIILIAQLISVCPILKGIHMRQVTYEKETYSCISHGITFMTFQPIKAYVAECPD